MKKTLIALALLVASCAAFAFSPPVQAGGETTAQVAQASATSHEVSPASPAATKDLRGFNDAQAEARELLAKVQTECRSCRLALCQLASGGDSHPMARKKGGGGKRCIDPGSGPSRITRWADVTRST